MKIDPFKFPLAACLDEWRTHPMPHVKVDALIAATRLDEVRRSMGIPSCTFPTLRRELPL